jgi:hypothetical protein
MSLHHRISAHRLGVVLAVAFVALGGFATGAHAAATSRSRVAARTSAPVSAATISSDLLKATGHSASQLSTRAACGSAPAGRFRCYARVLTVRSTGRAASLLHAPHAATTRQQEASATATAPLEYTSGYLQSAYDTTWLSANRGAADTVAIVDAYGDSTAYSDMERFRSANGLQSLPTCTTGVTSSCFEVVNQSGQTTNLPSNSGDETDSWNIEESLDIDAVSSLCPLCKILMVEANSDDDTGSADLETAVSTAAQLGANQISLSWGTLANFNRYPASEWESPYSSITASTILAASGDDAYQGSHTVDYPAALSDVTAVGGTTLTSDSTVARGFDESAWKKQTCSGGSTCGTESGCDTSQSQPTYQDNTTTDCSGRAYNDVSADADPNTGLEIYDSQPGDEGCGGDNWCIVGGTSLATPLAAAFEAITGISDVTPAWAYTDAPLLNDIVSGSDGSCSGPICNAGIGWDGPTGNGSIDGDVVADTVGSGPGIGALPPATEVTTSSADVSAEVNPNDSFASADTTYYWQYGTSTSYATSTASAPLSAGATFESATGTIPITEPCTYHYRIVASNAIGTVYGYDETLTTPQSTSAPLSTSTPMIAGTASVGQQLSEQGDQWSGEVCDTTYQWQESQSPTGPWTAISGATSATYTPTSDNAGEYLDVAVTATNNGGSTSVGSEATGQIPTPATDSTSSPGTTTSTTTTPTGTTTTPTTTTTTTTTSNPSGATTTTTTVRFYRCARACTLINTRGAETYKPVKADYGRYIKVVTVVARIAGNVETDTTTTRWIGPVGAAGAGNISIGSAARVASASIIRGTTGAALAQVRVARRIAGKLTLVIRRETRAPTQVWAYVVSSTQVASATAARSLSRPATLSFTLRRGQTIRLVAVRT